MPEAAELHDRTDDQLAAAALAGNREAFGVLAARHYPGVSALVYRMTSDPQFAEDAAQEACLRAWQGLASYDPGRSANPQHAFRNWLYRIATHYTLDELRRRPPSLPLEAARADGDRRGLERTLQQRQEAEIVRQAVLSLPPASRSVLVLREYEGLAYREIAEVLELPLGTVMSRLNYARQKLRQDLQVLKDLDRPVREPARDREEALEQEAA